MHLMDVLREAASFRLLLVLRAHPKFRGNVKMSKFRANSEQACLAIRIGLLAPFLALLVPVAASGEYAYNGIAYPGAVSTDVFGINATGQIVGNAVLGNGDAIQYIYSGGTGGTFSVLPPLPDGYGQFAVYGINDSGTVVGGAVAPDGSVVGFVLNGTNYSFFSDAGRSFNEGRSIGSTGLVAGDASDADASGNPINAVGFVYDPDQGTFEDIVIPGSAAIIAHGNNAAGQVVGNAFLTTGPSIAFLREPGGALTTFQVAGASTRARGINDNGIIAGFIYGNGMPRQMGFVGNSSGYQLLAPNDTTLYTFVEGINNDGQAGGFYYDENFLSHGFIATPVVTPSGTTSDGSYTFTVSVVPDQPIFIDPPPALGFDYAIGSGDPAITTVTLPIGVGDSQYMLIVNGHEYALAGGQAFDFRAHGYPAGVGNFRVTDIEAAASLDPANPEAFPTRLTFAASGRFTGSMTPLCLNHALPAQAPAEAIRRSLAACR